MANQNPSGYQHFTCVQCGHAYLARSSACPHCGGLAKSSGEFTRKMNDEPDLKKGF